MIERSDRGSIAVARLAHGKANALDLDLLAELASTLEELEDSRVRAAVLTGSGTIFSAGVDLFKVLEGQQAYIDRFLPALAGLFRKLFVLPIPVVAAVNGHAIAGGCVLAAACDHRVMARGSARIGLTELLVGVPFPTLPLEIMRFVLPPQYLQAALYTGATHSPEEALRRGFVDELVEPDQLLDRACETARQLASIPAESFRITKQAARMPVLERVERTSPSVEARIVAAWKDPQTLKVIRGYVDRTIKRDK